MKVETATVQSRAPRRRRFPPSVASTTRLNPQTTPRHELRAEKARRNKEAALNAFIGKKAEIDEMLARLQSLSDEHFNCHPDEIGWATVGSLEHYASLLKRITDSAFSEGEHAE